MGSRRIGLLTAGGDCPGLNALIRAVVLAAAPRRWDVLGIEDATNGLVDLEYHRPLGNHWLTFDDVEDILARGGTILGTSNKSDPFHYVVQRDGHRVEVDVSDRMMENYRALGLEGIIWVGGDGSMRIAQRMGEKGMHIVGVPKTIDLDLGGTDYSFGFHTAVETITSAVDRLQDTAESHDRVMIVEVMGRDAGFLALHGALAGGAHICLIPELPYRIEPVLAKIRERCNDGLPYSIAIVAEGAAPAGGAPSYAGPPVPGEMPKLLGAGARLGTELEPHLDLDTRVTVLGHVQRGGSPNQFDRILATRFGVAAVEAIERGDFGRMVSLRTPDIVMVPISEAIAKPRRVEPSSSLLHAARSVGVELGE
ncbi:MAG TPA: ATP-dependent 6-phosphofructokinase [Thermoanaerobaculia bacterium]|nr:ATP-dependent 6-phosphofructokinase [Thermoanaerobaculia bacterium]